MPDDLVSLPRGPEIIERFLENVRGTIPLSIEQIEIMLRYIAAATDDVSTYLDVGSGAMIAAAILDEYPSAHAVVLERSGKRLEATQRQVGQAENRVSFQSAPFEKAEWVQEAASLAPYDLITCGVELPLLPDARQRPFFREMYGLLRPGGFFLAMQYVASATRWTQSRWDDQMIETIFGEFIREDEKAPRTAIARAYYEQIDARARHVAPLEVQCDWLRETGFENVDCFLKISELAVFGGQKPHGRPIGSDDS